MLHSILKHKIGAAVSKGFFEPCEDTLTSSVIGLMQYLPKDLFWRILKGACGASSKELPESVGEIKEFHFWERLDGKGTKNAKTVEPDVWVETDTCDILIEAKRYDNSSYNSQDVIQWSNQIIALRNQYRDDDNPKPIIYIAIGGNNSLIDSSISFFDKQQIIHTASWYNLLNCVLNELSIEGSESYPIYVRRVLRDIISYLDIHRFGRIVWLDTLAKYKVSNKMDAELMDLLGFDNRPELSVIHSYTIKNWCSLNKIWTVIK